MSLHQWRPWQDLIFPTGCIALAVGLAVTDDWPVGVGIGLVGVGAEAWRSRQRAHARALAEHPGALGGWWAVLDWPDDFGGRPRRTWARLPGIWVYLQATHTGLRVIPGRLAQRWGGLPVRDLPWSDLAGAFEVKLTSTVLGSNTPWRHAEVCLELVGDLAEAFRLPTDIDSSDGPMTPAELTEEADYLRDVGRELVGDRYRVGTRPLVLYTQPGTDLVSVVNRWSRGRP